MADPGARSAVSLVIVPPPEVDRADFEEIRRLVRQLAPQVRVTLLRDGRCRLPRIGWTRRPTMLFSPAPLRRLKPARGRIFQGRLLGKANEYRALEAQGIPIPRWALLTENERPDLSSFGPYVVVKPDLGGRGADVKIYRKGRVRWKPREARRGAGWGNDDRIVQEFVYTGPWPVSYRVVTLFGRALLCFRIEASHERAPLRDRYGFTPAPSGSARAPGGSLGERLPGTIVSNGRGCDIDLRTDREVIELAENAHAAFPEIPLLGFDVVREQPSGRLYVLEANAGGSSWHFSTRDALRLRREKGLDPYTQLNGLAVAARVLAERALATAE
jgi:hypothetical protein